ncbi:hypothetical protein M0D69_04360 [Caballeronia sp. SEWSISQ10-4 2]|nr:hypothetical protein [Caballeronia sp. SEWSISQ10-4 2]MDN7177255.1 hypothetical protein [Caballeronia sp. SEWSISQ10-4 2]
MLPTLTDEGLIDAVDARLEARIFRVAAQARIPIYDARRLDTYHAV